MFHKLLELAKDNTEGNKATALLALRQFCLSFLLNYLFENNGLLKGNQHGFHSNRSSLTNLLTFYNDVY